MAISTVDFSGLERIKQRLNGFANINFQPLVDRWARRLVDDNARFALAGLDCDEKEMEPTVRESLPRLSRRLGTGKPIDPKMRQSRIITMAESAGFHNPTDNTWFARLAWPGFTDKKGRGILSHLRKGVKRNARPGLRGGLIQRDVLSRIRPSTLEGARQDLRAFLGELIK